MEFSIFTGSASIARSVGQLVIHTIDWCGCSYPSVRTLTQPVICASFAHEIRDSFSIFPHIYTTTEPLIDHVYVSTGCKSYVCDIQISTRNIDNGKSFPRRIRFLGKFKIYMIRHTKTVLHITTRGRYVSGSAK